MYLDERARFITCLLDWRDLVRQPIGATACVVPREKAYITPKRFRFSSSPSAYQGASSKSRLGELHELFTPTGAKVSPIFAPFARVLASSHTSRAAKVSP